MKRASTPIGEPHNDAPKATCAAILQTLPPPMRSEILTESVYDRLRRKLQTIDSLNAENRQNWTQTLYMLYVRMLGDPQNREAYLELTRRVPYKILLRESEKPDAVKCMLLGVAGLLNDTDDEEAMRLLDNFAHYRNKYGLQPMNGREWRTGRMRPANQPRPRIEQAAAFLTRNEFVMERVTSCRTPEEVQRLFCLRAPRKNGTGIGSGKAAILGINLVAPVQFAYGSYTNNETLRQNAIALLERLPAEENRYIRQWKSLGVTTRNAFETQALLQLSTQYCATGHCAECPVERYRNYCERHAETPYKTRETK